MARRSRDEKCQQNPKKEGNAKGITPVVERKKGWITRKGLLCDIEFRGRDRGRESGESKEEKSEGPRKGQKEMTAERDDDLLSHLSTEVSCAERADKKKIEKSTDGVSEFLSQRRRANKNEGKRRVRMGDRRFKQSVCGKSQ